MLQLVCFVIVYAIVKLIASNFNTTSSSLTGGRSSGQGPRPQIERGTKVGQRGHAEKSEYHHP